MPRAPGRAALCLALPLLAGCPSASVLGSARTLDQGKVEGGVAVGAGLALLDVDYVGVADVPFFPDPRLELVGRVGVLDRLELEGRLGTNGIEAGAKVGLRRTDGHLGDIDLSLAPSVSVTPTYLISAVQLPLLLGFNLGGGSQVVVAWRLQAWVSPLSQEPLLYKFFLFTPGVSAGVYLRLSPHLRLMPEVECVGGPGIYEAHAGVALLFGN